MKHHPPTGGSPLDFDPDNTHADGKHPMPKPPKNDRKQTERRMLRRIFGDSKWTETRAR